MKKLFAILILVAFAVSGVAQETHFDFSITNSTGYDMYYRIVDTENQQVEVTYPCQHNDNYWWGYIKPEGKLMLSDTVTYNGTAYTVVAIGDHAFCGCSDLRGELEFPQTISAIGAGAFKGCSNLSGSLNIPATLKRIEDETFSGCSSFSGKLALPDSVQYVGSQAFLNCSNFRGMMMLPATLAFVGEQAFKGCTNINSMSVKSTSVPTTATNAFDEIPTWITVNVPYSTKEAYQNAPGWSRFASHTVEKSIWTGNATPWAKGSGTSEDPYLIESAENLAWLAKSVNERPNMHIETIYVGGWGFPEDEYCFEDIYAYQDTCFKLVTDISLNKSEQLWKAIGNTYYINENDYNGPVYAPHHTNNYTYYYYAYFLGHFDGNEHVISGVQYYALKDNIGLFGIIDSATVCNLTIDDLIANPYSSYNIGGLVARANNSTIYNCHTSGEIHNSTNGGGIVAIANKCRIEQCTANIDLYGTCVGGIAGIFTCDSASTSQNGVFNCSFIGNNNNSQYVGGIIALGQSVSEGTGTIRVENCFSRCTITKICPDPNHYVQTGNYIFGGLVGEVANIDSLCILNCYNNGTITTVPANIGNPQYYGSGILAYSNPNTTIYIKNCYHVGSIEAQHTGGIIAQNTNMTVVRNCYFEQGSAPDDGFGVPMSSDYMKTEAFVNRLNNGSTVYRMDTEPYENDGYPIFGTDGLIFVGAEWYYQILCEDGTITYQHLQCVGDTTINEERPKIIIRSNTHYDRDTISEETHEYVYEENGVVYWWNKTLSKFTVLYDFGAEVGDEWTIEVENETITTRVYETEIQYIDGIPYKRLTIADPNDDFSGSLLSSIGHQTSFFPERLMTRGKGYRVEGLRCYWLDDELIYKQGDEDCDAIYDEWHHGIDETTENSFTVYPNPTNSVLFVETQSIASLPYPTYRITNLMGQILLQGSINAETQRIDISMLPAGMYFISVGELTRKFVVRQ